ncbi:hypothetical protein [Nocardioides bizhenqiangii]|uniref:Uncharacterized protein n=1 Tax=Nocardioides bizhenqiangii TaxID=3095076 RepID=A0ABZ0ZRN6_9ACTN|nr:MULTISPECIES: hypothetical protein [unclassified Nocardioides]MDZ5619539.1 hypothetical protein [Nocardioides sp. HM23]WQQ26444.1 hypothetical protein SHK19_21125 [Nocardioides sp. HM61]
MTATRDPVTRPPLWAYPWWLVVGALVSFGFLAGFTIGIPFLLLGLALAGAGVALPVTRNRGVSALPAGIGLPLLYIAWLNRDGPGTICTSSAHSTSCEEQWNPWPWVAAAVVLVLVSVATALLVRLATRRR